MKTLTTRVRAAPKRARPSAKPAAPHKSIVNPPRPIDEDTRVLIEAIKGLKGIR